MAETNLKDVPGLGFKYTNTPETPIADFFLNPCLKNATSFDAVFGFFSSESLVAIAPGLSSLFSNGGKIRLAVCTILKEEDSVAIQEGYRERVESSFLEAERRLIDELRKAAEEEPDSVALLREMIAANRLEIIAVGPYQSSGIMHEKKGIFEDSRGNSVAFIGSPNLTLCGISRFDGRWNYESLYSFRSWLQAEDKYCRSARDEIEGILDGSDPWIQRKDLSLAVKDAIDSFPKKKGVGGEGPSPVRLESPAIHQKEQDPFSLYPYQRQAVDKWFDMGCRGFFLMATGTGKTRTALAAVKEYWERVDNAVLVVSVPLLALAEQWEREIRRWLGVRPIQCNSKNPEWKDEVLKAISGKNFLPRDARVVLLVTYHSKKKLEALLDNYPQEKCLLLADEAHHLDPDWLENARFFGPCIGLSATPGTGMPGDVLGPRIIQDFGGLAINLSLEEALRKGVLVPYDYHPLFCHASEKEEGQFRAYTKLIAAALQDANPARQTDLARLIRLRSGILANCEDKVSRLDEFFLAIKEEDRDHLIVYCGAGDLYGGNLEEERRYIEHVHKCLTETFPDFSVSPFTSHESGEERRLILRGFEQGSIRAITAIRCLDEGVDIPSIRAALILASGSTLREFIQRRGRILRLSKESGKDHASIYDVICLPQGSNSQALARYELNRFYEFARSARNWESGLRAQLERLLRNLGLGTIEEAFLNKAEDFALERMEMEGEENDGAE